MQYRNGNRSQKPTIVTIHLPDDDNDDGAKPGTLKTTTLRVPSVNDARGEVCFKRDVANIMGGRVKLGMRRGEDIGGIEGDGRGGYDDGEKKFYRRFRPVSSNRDAAAASRSALLRINKQIKLEEERMKVIVLKEFRDLKAAGGEVERPGRGGCIVDRIAGNVTFECEVDDSLKRASISKVKSFASSLSFPEYVLPEPYDDNVRDFNVELRRDGEFRDAFESVRIVVVGEISEAEGGGYGKVEGKGGEFDCFRYRVGRVSEEGGGRGDGGEVRDGGEGSRRGIGNETTTAAIGRVEILATKDFQVDGIVNFVCKVFRELF